MCDDKITIFLLWKMKKFGGSVILFLAFQCFLVTECNPDAKRLYDDLLSTYNRLIRPVSNNTETVLVKLGLRLSQLIDLVSLKQLSYFKFYLTVASGFCLVFWKDKCNLNWMKFIKHFTYIVKIIKHKLVPVVLKMFIIIS